MRAWLASLLIVVSILSATMYLSAQTPTAITLDVKPHSAENSINVRSHGVIPVAVLCTLDTTDPSIVVFDPSTIDQGTLFFGPSGEPIAMPCALEDVNGDGCPDLMCHFATQGAGLACGDTSVALTGAMTDGTLISGSDTITTVGCQGKGPKP
jgi:hypothetical protein